jgi:hypothetical protein
MSGKPKQTLPPVPPSFFLSLDDTQRNQLTHLLNAYRVHYANYYSFSVEMLKKSGFMYEMYETLIWNETIKQSGISKSMFRLLLLIYFLEKSPKYKNIRLTQDVIFKASKLMRYVNRLWPQQNIKYLEKYGWLTVYLLRWKKKQYFVSEQGHTLITSFGVKYAELFNDFFEPLSL